MSTYPRQLVPGTNIGDWSERKYTRGLEHLSELARRVEEYHAGQPLWAHSELTPDRMALETRLRIRTPPPIGELALILGDAVHNFRAAFDAVAWEMATLDGAVPERETLVKFPVTKTLADFKNWTKQTPTIPDVMRARIGNLQPHNESDPDAISLLPFLHELDITDKHRTAIAARMAPIEAEMQTVLALEAGQVLEQMHPIVLPPLEDGAVLMKVVSDRPIASAEDTPMPVRAVFIAENRAGQGINLESATEFLTRGVRVALDLLYTGAVAIATSEQSEAGLRPTP
ncbi:hypothetical protein GCM10027515_31840 [Schumannella luteola]|uniref:Uncharacterized protein n=1 Tax=Schumannella luteola TaxID=472059 RepID=A0A852YP73_9MICO|nr:hypothetical protein [Schumannella luteola]NYG99015.1 hypothetical protein [Schumannella luteola]TPX06374.1 hypothetical protein FJ656_01705 [Schumannella luteola]